MNPKWNKAQPPTNQPQPQGFPPAGPAVANGTVNQIAKSGKTETPVGATTESFEMPEVDGPLPGVPPVVVRYGVGVTVNCGNFQTVRVDASIEIPTRSDCVDTAQRAGRAWVEAKVAEGIPAARALLTKKGGLEF